jgi:hypothetical protein
MTHCRVMAEGEAGSLQNLEAKAAYGSDVLGYG